MISVSDFNLIRSETILRKCNRYKTLSILEGCERDWMGVDFNSLIKNLKYKSLFESDR